MFGFLGGRNCGNRQGGKVYPPRQGIVKGEHRQGMNSAHGKESGHLPVGFSPHSN